MSVDERVRAAAERLAGVEVGVPSFDLVVGRHRRRGRMIVGAASVMLMVGAASVWFAVGRGGDSVMSTDSAPPATSPTPHTTVVTDDATEPEPPPPTVSTTAPGPDTLTETLAMLGVDTATAPDAAVRLAGAAWCGVEQRGLTAPLLESQINERARRCFLDHHLSAQHAVFVEQAPTTEGDPIVTVWRTLADGTVEVDIDSTRDTLGSGTWDAQTCARLTTVFPQAPVLLPPSYFGCDDTSAIAEAGRIDTEPAPMPAWFEQRRELPLCGYENLTGAANVPARTCLADAVQHGTAAEYVQLSYGFERERSARWFRSLGNDTFEVLEWQSGLELGTPVQRSQWLIHRCTTIHFSDQRLDGTAALPELNAEGECSQTPLATITGTIIMTGGPAPDITIAILGTVTITETTTNATFDVTAEDDGRFVVDVPAGTYTLSATSPSYNDEATPCTAPDQVTVRPGDHVTTEIVCQMK